MSVRINTNASAINTHRHVVNNAKVQERNLEKLASGMKVNRGVDGPAHIQIGGNRENISTTPPPSTVCSGVPFRFEHVSREGE